MPVRNGNDGSILSTAKGRPHRGTICGTSIVCADIVYQSGMQVPAL